jgi:hypothetical protein
VFWTLQNIKEYKFKQYKLHHGSMFSAAIVFERMSTIVVLRTSSENLTLPSRLLPCAGASHHLVPKSARTAASNGLYRLQKLLLVNQQLCNAVFAWCRRHLPAMPSWSDFCTFIVDVVWLPLWNAVTALFSTTGRVGMGLDRSAAPVPCGA